jgi:hypothetical protein
VGRCDYPEKVKLAGERDRAVEDVTGGQRGASRWLQAEVDRLAPKHEHRAIAVFDALDELLRREAVDGVCVLNTPPPPPGGELPIHPANARSVGVTAATLEGHGEQAGAVKPGEFGRKLQILVTGAIIAARCGDDQAARRARSLAQRLLETSR